MRPIGTYVIAAVGLAALATLNAHAAQQRTFVASYGSDANPCKLAAPCATFATAAVQTQDGGEIVVLDSGQFGPVTITQSIAIIGPRAVHAGVNVVSGAGIAINAPGKQVRLEGLSVEATGGAVGVHIDDAYLVVVERCTIRGFSDSGIKSPASGARVLVHDTVVSDSAIGIRIDGATTIVVDHSRIEKNGGQGVALAAGAATIANSTVAFNGTHGIGIQGAKMAVTGTLVAENGGDGIRATAGASTLLTLSLSMSEVRRNSNGVVLSASAGATIGADIEDTALSDHSVAAISASNAGGTVKMTLSNNSIVRNATGVANSGALIESRGNNTFNYNGTNGAALQLFPAL